jgi:hypothetical protein
MAHRELSPQRLQEIRELAAQWGKIVARRAFGDFGPGTDVDLSMMEAIARAASTGLLEGTLSTLLQQQTQVLGPQHPCPDCGQPCPVQHEDRPLIAPNAQVNYHEPRCHCPRCRRDFFPPPDCSATG